MDTSTYTYSQSVTQSVHLGIGTPTPTPPVPVKCIYIKAREPQILLNTRLCYEFLLLRLFGCIRILCLGSSSKRLHHGRGCVPCIYTTRTVVFVSTTSIFHIVFSTLCVLSTQWYLGAMAPQTRLVPLLRLRSHSTCFLSRLRKNKER